MKCPNLLIQLLAVVFVALGSGPARAAIAWNGNVSPSNPAAWDSGTRGYIGETSDGDISVSGGSKLIASVGYLGKSPSANGEVTVAGTGSQWMVSNYLGVGYDGSGTLNVQAGGAVGNFGNSYLGNSPGSMGVANVTGAGSYYLTRATFCVGNYGVGTVNVHDGGLLRSEYQAIVGNQTGAIGKATVSGNDSQWRNSGSLYVGREGAGTLSIQSGGAVSNASSYVGFGMGSTGEVTVTGAASTWSSNSALYVGREGSGRLSIQSGGTVMNNSGSSYLGQSTGSTGEATVTGTGSQWINRGYLYVGGAGQGTLTISRGGLVSVGTGGLTIDADLNGADSFVNVSTGGMLALKSDRTGADSLSDFFALVGGTKAIRYWDDALSDWTDITAATYGEDYTLKYLTTGDLTGYTLLTVGEVPPLLAGDYNDDGVIDAADYTVWRDNVGGPAGTLPNDVDGGAISAAQYDTWRANYGSVTASSASTTNSAVPEPSGVLLALSGLASAGLARRRKITT